MDGALKLDHDGLWDARTVPICPTGHRNVHFWIVRMMYVAKEKEKVLETLWVPDIIKAVKPRDHRNEFKTACLALERFTEMGGSLSFLIAKHQYGEA